MFDRFNRKLKNRNGPTHIPAATLLIFFKYIYIYTYCWKRYREETKKKQHILRNILFRFSTHPRNLAISRATGLHLYTAILAPVEVDLFSWWRDVYRGTYSVFFSRAAEKRNCLTYWIWLENNFIRFHCETVVANVVMWNIEIPIVTRSRNIEKKIYLKKNVTCPFIMFNII